MLSFTGGLKVFVALEPCDCRSRYSKMLLSFNLTGVVLARTSRYCGLALRTAIELFSQALIQNVQLTFADSIHLQVPEGWIELVNIHEPHNELEQIRPERRSHRLKDRHRRVINTKVAIPIQGEFGIERLVGEQLEANVKFSSVIISPFAGRR
jgi:hypothetical protein